MYSLCLIIVIHIFPCVYVSRWCFGWSIIPCVMSKVFIYILFIEFIFLISAKQLFFFKYIFQSRARNMYLSIYLYCFSKRENSSFLFFCFCCVSVAILFLYLTKYLICFISWHYICLCFSSSLILFHTCFTFSLFFLRNICCFVSFRIH